MKLVGLVLLALLLPWTLTASASAVALMAGQGEVVEATADAWQGCR
ncbi:MAG: hypothetical protein ABR575_00200 [Actinomycetota bacterium]